MKKSIGSILKVVLPLALGVFLIWYFTQSLSEKDRIDIAESFQKADYGWILFSLVFAVLSHVSRAYRWSYTLKPLGYKPKFLNNFFAVMIAYLVNLAVPRLGELTRCGVMARYENIPFDKLLGTVIAERIADLILLVVCFTAVVIIQFNVIEGLLVQYAEALAQKFSMGLVLGALGAFLLGGIGLLVLFFNKSFQHPILLKVRGFVFGLFQGVKSIWDMEDKWAFIGHTIFIWIMYVFMFYVCFFSLPETSGAPFGAVLTGFVMGGLTIVVIQGGIGAYPVAVMKVLLLYGIAETTGYAFGWIVWTAQTLLLLILGAASFVLMPWYNKRIANTQNAAA